MGFTWSDRAGTGFVKMARVPMLVIWPPSRTPSILTLFLISVAEARVPRFAALLRLGSFRLCSFWCFLSLFLVGWLVERWGLHSVVGVWATWPFFCCPRFLSDVVSFLSRLWRLLVVEGFRSLMIRLEEPGSMLFPRVCFVPFDFVRFVGCCCIPLEVGRCVFLLIGGWVETSLVYPISFSTPLLIGIRCCSFFFSSLLCSLLFCHDLKRDTNSTLSLV